MCVWGGGDRKRAKERERQTEIETDRQTDRQRDRERETETERKRHRERDTRHATTVLVICRNDMVCHKTYYIIKQCTNNARSHSSKLQSTHTNTCLHFTPKQNWDGVGRCDGCVCVCVWGGGGGGGVLSLTTMSDAIHIHTHTQNLLLTTKDRTGPTGCCRTISPWHLWTAGNVCEATPSSWLWAWTTSSSP